jgi:hypothetical protein
MTNPTTTHDVEAYQTGVDDGRRQAAAAIRARAAGYIGEQFRHFEMAARVADGEQMPPTRQDAAPSEASTLDKALPYTGGTVHDLRARILRHGFVGEKRFNDMLTGTAGPFTPEHAAESRIAHYACLYGYATASLLGFIADRFGEAAAFKAAAMVDNMGTNGGAPYCGDFPYPPADEAEPTVAAKE